MRKCIGCRQSFPQDELRRFTMQNGEFRFDTEMTRAEGRGYYLCNNDECLKAAIKSKSFNRIARCNVDTDTIMRLTEDN